MPSIELEFTIWYTVRGHVADVVPVLYTLTFNAMCFEAKRSLISTVVSYIIMILQYCKVTVLLLEYNIPVVFPLLFTG